MTDKVKQLAPQIWSAIQKANKILLHCHPNPDGDSVGGVLASKFALEGLGKSAVVIRGDSPIPSYLSSLPGCQEILSKSYLEVDLAEFDLFLIQDSSSLGMISKLGEVKFPDTLATVVIDHHSTNGKFAQINLVDTSYPAICQILFDLFQQWKIRLTPEIAINLFVGMYTDTGGLKYPLTTSDTFQAAAVLAKTGIDFPKVIFEMENSLPAQTIEYLGLFYSSIEHYFSGKVAICSVTFDQLKKKDISADIEVPELANSIKSAIGNEIGISLTEEEPSVVRVSMGRRSDKYDLAKIATATGAGGGHPPAAGATIKKPMPQAKQFLLETIQRVYPDLGEP